MSDKGYTPGAGSPFRPQLPDWRQIIRKLQRPHKVTNQRSVKIHLDNFLKYLPIAILAAYVLLSIASFWMSQERELIDYFDDDAYYYFKIARNIVDNGKLTFDGKNLTNGFHPLWLLVLIPFYLVLRDPILVLRAIGIFSVLLAGFTGYLGLRHIFQYSLLSYTLAAVLVLSCIISFGSTGMETTILIPLLVMALIMLEQTKPWRTSPENKEIVTLGMILSLVQLARLDAVLLNIVILLFVVYFNYTLGRQIRAISLGLFPFVTGALYLASNYAMFGHIIPTSGIAKSMQTDSHLINYKFLGQLTNPNNPVDGNLWIVFLGMFVFSVGYTLLLLLTRMNAKSTHLSEIHYVPIIIASSFIIFASYQLFRTSWVLWRWYAYPVLLMSIFVIPYITEQVEQRLRQYKTFRFALRAITIIVVAPLLIRMCIVGIRWGYWSKSLGPSFKYDNYLVAQDLNKSFPSPVTFAMGDRAGSFAYFFNGNVLQLEGLVGDYRLLEALETNTLMDYMSEFGVQYVISYIDPPPHYSQWTLLTPLPQLSSGPHAEILLCRQTELFRFNTQNTNFYVWRWPSCDSEGKPGDTHFSPYDPEKLQDNVVSARG